MLRISRRYGLLLVTSITMVVALSFAITAVVRVMAQAPTPSLPALPTPGPETVPTEELGPMPLEERLGIAALAEQQGLELNMGNKITVRGVVIQTPPDTYSTWGIVQCIEGRPCDNTVYHLRRGHSSASIGKGTGNTTFIFAPGEENIFDFLMPFVTVRKTIVRPEGCGPPITITSPVTDITCKK